MVSLAWATLRLNRNRTDCAMATESSNLCNGQIHEERIHFGMATLEALRTKLGSKFDVREPGDLCPIKYCCHCFRPKQQMRVCFPRAAKNRPRPYFQSHHSFQRVNWALFFFSEGFQGIQVSAGLRAGHDPPRRIEGWAWPRGARNVVVRDHPGAPIGPAGVGPGNHDPEPHRGNLPGHNGNKGNWIDRLEVIFGIYYFLRISSPGVTSWTFVTAKWTPAWTLCLRTCRMTTARSAPYSRPQGTRIYHQARHHIKAKRNESEAQRKTRLPSNIATEKWNFLLSNLFTFYSILLLLLSWTDPWLVSKIRFWTCNQSILFPRRDYVQLAASIPPRFHQFPTDCEQLGQCQHNHDNHNNHDHHDHHHNYYSPRGK